MSRPAGVTVSAVFLILGSVLTALIGAAMLFAGSFVPPNTPQPPFAMAMMVFMAVLFFGCALWGVLTAVGLFRMRRWARISILVIGALLVIFCGLSLVMLLVVMRQMPEFEATGTAGAIIGVVVGIYSIPILLGLWWLIYFNRAAVKAEFLHGVVPDEGPRRPLSIAVIAWHAIAFGLGTLAFLVMGNTPYVFGIVLTGWAAALTNLVLAATELAIGFGLLKMKPWSHAAAVWFCVVVMMQALVGVFLSNQDPRVAEMIQNLSLELHLDSTPLPRWSFLVDPVVVWGTFGCALWYLFTRKKAFLEAGKAAQATA